MPTPRANSQAEEIFHPDDHDFSHPDHDSGGLALLGPEPLSAEEEDDDHAHEISSWKSLPWWRRPSPYWLIFGTCLSSTGFAALLAPKVALYTALVCRVHRPEYVANNINYLFPLTHGHLVSFDTAVLPLPQIFDESQIEIVDTVYTPFLNDASLVHTPNGPDSEQSCSSDPVVQAVVARLNAVFSTSMGVLSCFTAGWWGSLSDRYGRRVVLLASIFGLFVAEFTHIITAWFVDVLPGGYWFPLVGFLIEGLCGSMPSGVAANHAYLADTTDPSTRSRYFALALGLVFMGAAVGPALGGLLIRSTGTMMSVFYFSIILHGAYTIFVLLILPESLTRTRMRGARQRRRQEKANQTSRGHVLKGVVGFLSPIAVLLPEKSSGRNSLKQRRKDWSLFFIAIAHGLAMSTMGSIPYKFQYAAAQFNWTPEITNYYVSLMGATRALFLAVILPLIIRYFKETPVQLPSMPDEPLRGIIGPSPSRGTNSPPGTAQAYTSEEGLNSSSPAFDLGLARASAGLDAAAFLGMAVASTGTLFALTSTINSLATGIFPATQILALDIYTNRGSQTRGEIGKLFGALSVIQALGYVFSTGFQNGSFVYALADDTFSIMQSLYGFIYYNTVAVFPQAIMIVSMCTSLLVLTFLMLSIHPKMASDSTGPGLEDEQGSQRTNVSEILLAMENEVVEG